MKTRWINFGIRIDPETDEESTALYFLFKSARFVDFKEESRLLRLANEARDAARDAEDAAKLQTAGVAANEVTDDNI